MRSEELVQALYEPHVMGARRRFEMDGTVRMLLDAGGDPALFERSLIQYCCLGVYTTHSVAGWLRRAGERCLERGWQVVGEALLAHARHATGRPERWMQDARGLVQVWNAHRTPRLSAEALLAQPTASVLREYTRLNDEALGGAQPAGGLALMLELERLEQRLARCLIEQAWLLLPTQARGHLGFLEPRVVQAPSLPQLLGEVLALGSESALALGQLGARVPPLYLQLIQECLRAATTMRRPATQARAAL